METNKLFFEEFHLAGRQYHDVDEVWGELHVGTRLELVRDMENPFDPKAVAVLYYGKRRKIAAPYLLGYVPQDENHSLYVLLEMGWRNLFECRISQIKPDAHYENQIRITVRVKRNNQ